MAISETRNENRNGSEARALAQRCAELMADKKAHDIRILNLKGLADFADYFVIASADSDTHLKAVGDNVLDELARDGIKPYRTEGWQGMQWIILDFVEVVVHILYKEAREFYNIERLWADAPVEEFSDEAPVETPASDRGDTE